MAPTIELLLTALMATSAIARPASYKAQTKRSIFTVPVKARQLRAGADDMARVATKYATGIQDLLNVPADAVQGELTVIHDTASNFGSIIHDIGSDVGSIIHDLISSSDAPESVGVPTTSSEVSTAVPTVTPTTSVYEASSSSVFSSSSISAFSPSAPASVPTSSNIPPPSSVPTVVSSAPTTASTINMQAPTTFSSSVATASATISGQEGEVTTTPEANDIEYLSPVSIGGQLLNLDFDTGSSDLWVYSSELPASDIGSHSIYDPAKSPTFTDYPNATWSISYGDGSTASGSVGFDVVNVGGAIVQKQCVELAKGLSSTFLSDAQSDGLLGLGFSSINTVSPQKQQTFFENIMPQLDQPVFTASLGDHTTGVYEFGTVDPSKYSGEVYYTPVDSSEGYWTVSVPHYKVGNQTFTSSTSTAIADTGTSLLYLNQDAVDAYYSGIPGAGLNSETGAYTFPCGTSLPDFGLDIGGYFATIKGSEMTYEQVGGNQCFGGLQVVPGGAPFQILGDMFLKQFLAVFDGGALRFGVAEKPGGDNTQ